MTKRERKPILPEKGIHLYRFMKKALGAEKNAVDDRVAKSEKPQKSSGTSHAKVVRDGFSMPSVDYNFIAEIQSRGLEAGISATKSKVLRAGLRALNALPPDELKETLSAVEDVKTGRPLMR